MKIMELLFKSQPSTLPKVKEQRGAAIKKGMATVDVVVIDCTTLFEQAMELVMTLQEYPNLQKLNTEIRELQQQYDKVRATSHLIATTQCLARLQEGKQLLT